MEILKNTAFGLSVILLTATSYAQSIGLNFETETADLELFSTEKTLNYNQILEVNTLEINDQLFEFEDKTTDISTALEEDETQINIGNHNGGKLLLLDNDERLISPFSNIIQPNIYLGLASEEKEPFFRNKRNVYSSMWAFASLNYLYADLVGLMDANVLSQYQSGVVNGVAITPNFLTVAAGFMQIPIANVFLPHLIKNDKALRWVQIASGTIMTLVQSGTLFMGKPTPYYALFSAFEIAATTFITIDAIKWKPNSNQNKRRL